MPGTAITTSTNISVLDSKIVADVCAGNFVIDATPSIFFGSGASNVLGVKVKIVNPYGVTIKDYSGSYDITAPLSGNYTRVIPTQAGKVQYGNYAVTLELTDANSTKYYITKTVNVCTYNDDTNPCDNRVRLSADCKAGRFNISLSEPPVFKGLYSQSRTQTVVINFPTASGVTPITSNNGSFSVQLFEGVYKVVVTVCATYNLTDNVFLKLGYTGTFEKNVKCLLDYTCIWPAIKKLNDKITEDCSQVERDNNASVVLDALRLLTTAELANNAGEDASQYINDLEALLGCVCTCDCSGLPISNNAPSTNISIEGCNVVKNIVGLTDVYTIENYTYLVDVDIAQNIVTVSAPSLTSCQMKQTISFSIANAYTGIKTQINNTTEYNFWAGIIRLALAGLNVDCLTAPTGTLLQLMQSLVNKACAGGSCTATISNVTITDAGSGGGDVFTGSNVLISWDNGAGVFAVQIYIDDLLVGTVLSGTEEFLATGYADGTEHSYVLMPICANGTGGSSAIGTFQKAGCPSISPPVVSSNNVNGVACPYDLTALVSPPPVGITTEWHTANNTLTGTLVANPASVSSGVYYAFAKNADGCYSTSTVVTLICDEVTSCTAPQSLLVSHFGGTHNFVQFQSAAFPPPANSYTVKRRLFSDPDISGSYTTVGTPTWSPVLNRWTIVDTGSVNNVLYVYKAISNCGGSPGTTPFATYTYGYISCPSVALTPAHDYISYSFNGVGGGVDKYEVNIYDATGTVLIHTDTKLPAFSTPITGTFNYLTPSTDYRIEVKVYIGTYSTTCPQTTSTTLV